MSNQFLKPSYIYFTIDSESEHHNFAQMKLKLLELLETKLQSRLKEQQQAKKQLAELNTKIENLEERFVQGQMERKSVWK